MQIRTKRASHLLELLQNREPVRIFKVFHPVLELPMDLQVEETSESYHIIERYMDRILCGNGGKGMTRDTLFALLGIDRQAYEIATIFFDDLVENGHIEVLPNGGLKALPSAYRSVETQGEGKTALKYTKKLVSKNMLFDQFSGRLMPGIFYEAMDTVRHLQTLNEEEAKEEYATWLPRNATLLEDLAEFYTRARTTEYSGRELLECGLPQGFTGMNIKENGAAREAYCPYYLAIFSSADGPVFETFDLRRLNPIPWLDEMYRTEAYKPAKERLMALSGITENVSVFNPYCHFWPIKLFGRVCNEFGIYLQPTTQNYEWQVQDWQVDTLVSLCRNPKYQRTCLSLSNTEGEVFGDYEAGRVVRAVLTPEQKERLAAAADRDFTEKEPKEEELAHLEWWECFGEVMKQLIIGKKEDVQKALPGLKELATAPAAAYILGRYLAEQEGKPSQAKQWYAAAAEGEYLPAQSLQEGDQPQTEEQPVKEEQPLEAPPQEESPKKKEVFMDKMDYGALIRAMQEINQKHKDTGITRWAIHNGSDTAVGRRIVTDRETGERYVQSAALDMATREFKELTLQSDGTYAPKFKIGDPDLDPLESLENEAKNALSDADFEEDRGKQENNYCWAAAFGTVAAKLGSVKGAAVAAKAYRELRDKNNALRYAVKEEELGGTESLLLIANCYARGDGCTQSPERAVAYYRRAAETGNSAAIFKMGECYRTGFGVPQNIEEAVAWYQKSEKNFNCKSRLAALDNPEKRQATLDLPFKP